MPWRTQPRSNVKLGEDRGGERWVRDGEDSVAVVRDAGGEGAEVSVVGWVRDSGWSVV